MVSTEIVDILAAAGITTPDISILSDEFLAEVQQLEKKNLALEALRKLLNDEIRSRSKTNVVETKRFSERLEAAIARYHTNAISTVEVLQELIDLAKEVRAARKRGEDEGLSQDEIAFYDALAESENAVNLLGNDSLKVIAHELLVSLKGSVSVDWSHRESARADARSGEANSAQARLPARSTGGCSANGSSPGGGALRGLVAVVSVNGDDCQ